MPRLRTLLAVAVALAALVTASPASAQTPADPLPQWRISADVVVTSTGGGFSETSKAGYLERDAQSGAFTWTGSRTGSGRFDCPVSGFSGYDVQGSGTGTGHFDDEGVNDPAYWGLPLGPYSVVFTVAEGDFALTGTSYNCNGESSTGPSGSEGPWQAVIYLQGTAEDLAALPAGTERRLSYSHTDESGENTVKTTISYVATKSANDKTACNDGLSNDFDGLADLVDPGCAGPQDTSELGVVQCDNGIDDDRDGTFDWPADTGCENSTDDRELACKRGYLAKDWLGFSQGDALGLNTADASYGLAISWCTVPGESTMLESEPNVRVEENRGGGYLDAFGRALEALSLEVNQQWVPDKSQKARSESLPGGGMRVTAATGHFDVCVGLGGAIHGVSKRAFKLLPKKVRERLVRKFKDSATNSIERGYDRHYKKVRKDLIGKKNPNTGRKYTREARKKEARRVAGRRRRALYELLDALTGRLIDKAEFKACLRAWTPNITATIAVDGTATMIENGSFRGWLWRVAEDEAGS